MWKWWQYYGWAGYRNTSTFGVPDDYYADVSQYDSGADERDAEFHLHQHRHSHTDSGRLYAVWSNDIFHGDFREHVRGERVFGGKRQLHPGLRVYTAGCGRTDRDHHSDG